MIKLEIKEFSGCCGSGLHFVSVHLRGSFFASNTLHEAIFIIIHAFDGIESPISYLHEGFATIGLDKRNLLLLALSISELIIFDYQSLKKDVISAVTAKKVGVKWLIYIFFCYG